MNYQLVVIYQHNSFFINSLLFHFRQWCKTISEEASLSLRFLIFYIYTVKLCNTKFHLSTVNEKFVDILKKKKSWLVATHHILIKKCVTY